MKIKYPSWADTQLKKYCALSGVEEVLLVIHNQYGRKYKNGKITEEQWQKFVDKHDKLSLFICQKKNEFREALKDNTTWLEGIDPEKFIEE